MPAPRPQRAAGPGGAPHREGAVRAGAVDREPDRRGRVSDAAAAAQVDTDRVALLLAAVAAVLVVVGAVVNVVIYQVLGGMEADAARVLARFDLGHEPSVPAWFSSSLLLLDAAMLLLIARATRAAGGRYAPHWFVLGIIFVGLSIDEAALFHEMIDTALSRGLETDGILTFPWVLAGGGFALAVGAAYIPFLLAIPRRFAALFVVSGAIFVGGAVGMELASATAIDRHTVASLAHAATQTVEEAMEMAGAILFFFALGRYWSAAHGRVRLVSGGGRDH